MSAKHASKTNNQKRKKKKIFTFAKFITTRTQRILFFFWSEAPFFSVLHISTGAWPSWEWIGIASSEGGRVWNAGDFRRASEGKKRGDQQAGVEHISPSLSSSLSLAHLALPLLLFAFARMFSLSLSRSLSSLIVLPFSFSLSLAWNVARDDDANRNSLPCRCYNV